MTADRTGGGGVTGTPQPTPAVVYAVVYSNYEPAETNSIWATRELAEARVESLNAEYGNGLWKVEVWEVRDG